jgi:hypothetical protein
VQTKAQRWQAKPSFTDVSANAQLYRVLFEELLLQLARRNG